MKLRNNPVYGREYLESFSVINEKHYGNCSVIDPTGNRRNTTKSAGCSDRKTVYLNYME